jgi:hypothetical protein
MDSSLLLFLLYLFVENPLVEIHKEDMRYRREETITRESRSSYGFLPPVSPVPLCGESSCAGAVRQS